MENFISVSPLKILDKSSRKGLGPGNLGVLIARAGLGKTACLIHIALDRIFRKGKIVHVSLEEGPEKAASYYNVIYSDLVKALNIVDINDENRMIIDRNRMILAYLNQSFDLDRLRLNLNNLKEKLEFNPDAMILDGLNFEKAERGIFEGLKQIAEEFQIEIWLSALSHRHISDINERGVTYPVNKIDDLFSIIIQVQAESSGVFLRLMKDHDIQKISDISVRLDPNTFLSLV
ncbi:MAG TPA: hypothetical protein ENN86_03625 [Desulfobacteraceae bacterium]|nr:hypothetical protein [Desulfobacteraceae bacterium]